MGVRDEYLPDLPHLDIAFLYPLLRRLPAIEQPNITSPSERQRECRMVPRRRRLSGRRPEEGDRKRRKRRCLSSGVRP